MSAIPKGVRKSVLRRDKWRCHYCDDKLYPNERRSTIDHKRARACGGTDDEENLVASCDRCNNAKGDMGYDLFVLIWEEVLNSGGGIEKVEAVCTVWKKKMAFNPATQWNAVQCGSG